jgi:hypothetical protein
VQAFGVILQLQKKPRRKKCGRQAKSLKKADMLKPNHLSLLPLLAAFLLPLFLAGCKNEGAPAAETADSAVLRLIPFRDGEQWGFARPGGAIGVEPEYEHAFLYDDGYGRVMREGLTGLVSPEGEVILPPTYNYIGEFRGGRAIVGTQDGLFGYIGTDGQLAVAPAYEEPSDFQHGRALVKKGGQYFLIRADGSLVKGLGKLVPYAEPPYLSTFEDEQAFDPGFLVVEDRESNRFGLIDSLGNLVLPTEYDDLGRPVGGLLTASKGGRYGLLRTDGAQVVPFEYHSIYRTSPQRFVAQRLELGNYAILDEQGKALTGFDFSGLYQNPDGYFVATKGEKTGLLDQNGKLAIPYEYAFLSYTRGYLVATDGQSRTGIISMDNQVVIPFEYDMIEPLRPGRFLADKDGKRGILDERGKWVLAPDFEVTYLGGDSYEYAEDNQRERNITLLTKGQEARLYNADGKSISDKKWLFCGPTDKFGITWATDANGRENCIGPDGRIYAKDPALKKVRVDNVQALYEAIGNDTEITLADGKYDLGMVTGATAHAEIFSFGFEDRTIVIKNTRNLTIKAENPGEAELMTTYAFVPALKLEECYNLALAGLKIGHDVAPGLCDGAVIRGDYLSYLRIDECDLYGSGTRGLEILASTYITLKNSIIRECTTGLLSLENCTNVGLYDCRIFDNQVYSHLVELDYSYNIAFERVEFKNSHSPREYGPFVFFKMAADFQGVQLKDCTIVDCSTDYFASFPNVIQEMNVNRQGLTLHQGEIMNK